MTEAQKVPLKPWQRKSPVVEMEMTVRRLISRPVLDVATGTPIPLGPDIDDAKAWHAYLRAGRAHIKPEPRHAFDAVAGLLPANRTGSQNLSVIALQERHENRPHTFFFTLPSRWKTLLERSPDYAMMRLCAIKIR